jgi:adenine/guanine phosphoribosyltransferase-like PRPP-binding protein
VLIADSWCFLPWLFSPLAEKVGGVVVEAACIIELPFLKGMGAGRGERQEVLLWCI